MGCLLWGCTESDTTEAKQQQCVYLNLKAPNLSPNFLFFCGEAGLGFLCFSLVVESGSLSLVAV